MKTKPEDDPRSFLINIIQTMSMTLLWMVVHVLLGIYMGFGFFEESPGWKNIIYYVIFLVTLFFLIRYIKRKWF